MGGEDNDLTPGSGALTTKPVSDVMGTMKSLLSLCALLCCAQWQIVHAGSAVWKLTPTSSDWTRAANWTPKTVPNGPADVATFAPSNVTNLSLSAGVEVAGIVFNPDANAFTITNLPGTVLTVSGAGITNNSGLLQNFVNQEADTTSGELHFTNNATAGESVVYTNQTPLLGGRSPLIQFEDSSSASSAQFYNQSGKQSQGGLIQFEGNSTAANGTFHNTGDSSYQPPRIFFLEQASAGQALLTNEGAAEGIIGFYDTSTG